MLVDIRDFYFKCQVWEVRTLKLWKNLVVKHIDIYWPKERYQADTVLLLSYVSCGFKYLFTMVDHFTKYSWVIPMHDKKAETVLKAFKKWIAIHNSLDLLQTDNGSEFENHI